MTVMGYHLDHNNVCRSKDCGCRAMTLVIPGAEVRVRNEETGGEKGAKPEKYALIPVNPLAELARVYGHGARKYSDRNWERGYVWSLSYDALQRHLNAFWSGQDRDAESGCLHLAHAAFHCFALMEWLQTHPELDDRAKSAVAEE